MNRRPFALPFLSSVGFKRPAILALLGLLVSSFPLAGAKVFIDPLMTGSVKATKAASKPLSRTTVAQQAPVPVHITLLHVNDVYQMSPSGAKNQGGFARLATLIKQTEAENPNTLFVMAGDTISPSVASHIFQGAQMIDLWNQLGLDVAVLGNHEFDFGDDVLRQRLKESRFPWLAANVIDRKTGKTFADLPATVLKTMDGVKLGFIGLLTPDTLTSSHPGPTITFLDPVQSACANLNQLDKAGADVIIGLTHLPMNEDQRVARRLPMRMAMILGGHEHTLLESVAGGTPILKMDSDATTVGRVDLFIDPVTHTLNHIDWRTIPLTAAFADDPAIAATVKRYEEKIDTSLGEVIGKTTVTLDATQAANRREETNLGNFLTDSFRSTLKADVALINGGSIRSNTTYAPGSLTRKDILTILPFGNPMVKVEVRGSTLRKALENGVSRLGGEEGRFPQVSGLRFSYDGRKVPGQRVVSATVNNHPLDVNKVYTLATSVYLLEGGDDYAMFPKEAKALTSSPDDGPLDADLIVEAIQKMSGTELSPKVDGRIQRLDKP